MTIEFLGIRWLLLIGVACTTMGSFAASGMQIQPMSGVGIGYDGAEAFNQRYDAAPGSACDDKQHKMADEGTFFGSMAQFQSLWLCPRRDLTRLNAVILLFYHENRHCCRSQK